MLVCKMLNSYSLWIHIFPPVYLVKWVCNTYVSRYVLDLCNSFELCLIFLVLFFHILPTFLIMNTCQLFKLEDRCHISIFDLKNYCDTLCTLANALKYERSTVTSIANILGHFWAFFPFTVDENDRQVFNDVAVSLPLGRCSK